MMAPEGEQDFDTRPLLDKLFDKLNLGELQASKARVVKADGDYAEISVDNIMFLNRHGGVGELSATIMIEDGENDRISVYTGAMRDLYKSVNTAEVLEALQEMGGREVVVRYLLFEENSRSSRRPREIVDTETGTTIEIRYRDLDKPAPTVEEPVEDDYADELESREKVVPPSDLVKVRMGNGKAASNSNANTGTGSVGTVREPPTEEDLPPGEMYGLNPDREYSATEINELVAGGTGKIGTYLMNLEPSSTRAPPGGKGRSAQVYKGKAVIALLRKEGAKRRTRRMTKASVAAASKPDPPKEPTGVELVSDEDENILILPKDYNPNAVIGAPAILDDIGPTILENSIYLRTFLDEIQEIRPDGMHIKAIMHKAYNDMRLTADDIDTLSVVFNFEGSRDQLYTELMSFTFKPEERIWDTSGIKYNRGFYPYSHFHHTDIRSRLIMSNPDRNWEKMVRKCSGLNWWKINSTNDSTNNSDSDTKPPSRDGMFYGITVANAAVNTKQIDFLRAIGYEGKEVSDVMKSVQKQHTYLMKCLGIMG
jgi:hypothetical protein